MTARFSRFGIDTRSLTGWGTLETRIEGDFGGGAADSSNAVFRLRQAWAELGDERFRVLVGQANSLWNEGVFETLIDATNLNQSFVRQAQIRLTGRLAEGLTGMVSLEAPETTYTSAAGVFTPTSDLAGRREPGLQLGARPAGAADLAAGWAWRSACAGCCGKSRSARPARRRRPMSRKPRRPGASPAMVRVPMRLASAMLRAG